MCDGPDTCFCCIFQQPGNPARTIPVFSFFNISAICIFFYILIVFIVYSSLICV
ncbi:hypothetical protein HMPREF1548_05467 [Clostridium sp. KLE 1755]|nr:hypothetical protein HMPREF1548_05467 [Clostridium sp. KLE 1755]